MKEIDQDFTVIQGWMVTKLKLSGSRLLAYAIIYNYSIKNAQCTWSNKRFAEWLGLVKEDSARKVLRGLEQDGLIINHGLSVFGTIGRTHNPDMTPDLVMPNCISDERASHPPKKVKETSDEAIIYPSKSRESTPLSRGNLPLRVEEIFPSASRDKNTNKENLKLQIKGQVGYADRDFKKICEEIDEETSPSIMDYLSSPVRDSYSSDSDAFPLRFRSRAG